MSRTRNLSSVLVLVLLPLSLLAFPARVGTAAERDNLPQVNEVQTRSAASYGKLPLSFEANQGQTDSRVKFLSRGRGYSLFLTGDEAVLKLERTSQKSKVKSQMANGPAPRDQMANVAPPFQAADAGLKPGATTPVEKPTTDNGPRTTDNVLRMKLVGANATATVTGADELPGKSNYFIGNDPKKWRTNVPNYAKVRYQEVYPGVDLVYYGNQGGQLEYDFVVAPGADPSAITLDVGAGLAPPKNVRNGAMVPIQSAQAPEPTKRAGQAPPLRIAADGDLVVTTNGGEIRFHKPVVYQEQFTVDSSQLTVQDEKRNAADNPKLVLSEANASKIQNRKFLDGHYTLDAQNRVRFQVGPYDRSKPLFIDPVLSYSTYLGGSGDENYSFHSGIAADSSGNAYVTGYTASFDFPTANPLQATNHGSDAFVSKINADGSALVYSTYLGGSMYDEGNAVAVDSSGNAYLMGDTFSTDFPTVNPLQATNHGRFDEFVAKLNAAGSALVYSTYLGGSGEERGQGIAVDSSGNAYVTGYTTSTDFPTVNPLQATNHGAYDAFVAKLNAAGSALVYSTYLGGTSPVGAWDEGYGIAADSSGNAYVTGFTGSTDFPTVKALQATNHGGYDAFVSKINADGSSLVYSTYLGGRYNDIGQGIAIDSSGNAYVAGYTSSDNFPLVSPLQARNHGLWDAFVAKLNASGSALVYSTYLGGNANDLADGIALDSSGNAYVMGETSSSDFPTVNPLQATNHGGYDAFVAKLNAAGSALVYSTYLGGSSDENAYGGGGIAADSSGNAYVTGYTTSTDFPTVNPLQGSNHGGYYGYDAFVAKISPGGAAPSVNLSPTSLTFGPQGVGTTSASQAVTLTNAGDATLSVSSIVASGDFAQTNDCGSYVAAGGDCTISVTFTPTSAGTRTGAITINDDASDSPQVVTLTGTGVVRPKLMVSVLSQSKAGSTLTLTLKLTNTGTGDALNTLINQIVPRRLGGTGTVTYLGPPLPIAVGNLAVGASTTVVLTFNVPSTVTKFSVTENGTMQDTIRETLSFASSQVVFP